MRLERGHNDGKQPSELEIWSRSDIQVVTGSQGGIMMKACHDAEQIAINSKRKENGVLRRGQQDEKRCFHSIVTLYCRLA